MDVSVVLSGSGPGHGSLIESNYSIRFARCPQPALVPFNSNFDFSGGGGGRSGGRERPYAPRRWIREHYGDAHAAPRLMRFVLDNFADRVKLPEGTTGLFPSGA